MTAATQKLNIRERIEYFHVPMSYTLPKGARKTTRTASIIFGLYSTWKSTYISYPEICALTGFSSATVASANRQLDALGMIEATRAGGVTKYVAKVRPAKLDYITLDAEELNDRGIVFRGKFFHLTRTQCIILHTIMSRLTYEKVNGQERGIFECLNNRLANMVGCDGSTAGDALNRLMKIKVLSRIWKARNRYERNKYIVDREFLEDYRKHTEERKERARRRAVERNAGAKISAENDVLDARADFERHHAENHARAIEAAEKNVAIARADAAFREAEKAQRKLEIETAKAEVFSPLRLPELQAELEAANAARRAALDRLGISSEDLTPQWTCARCSDTGWLPDGRMCGCYRPPMRRRAVRRRDR